MQPHQQRPAPGLHIDLGRCLLIEMSERPVTPWVTYLLIAANLVMFAVEIVHGADPISPTPQQILELGGSFPPLTLGGEWWRLGASMFLHFGLLHLALNMVCLYQARAVELIFGRAGFAAIYLVAGLIGGVATLLFSASNTVSAGASGAVFGIYGAFGAFLVLRRSQIEDEAWKRLARSIGQFLIINLAVGVFATGISLSAHGGGLIAGFAVAAALLAGAAPGRRRVARALGLAALGVGLTAAAVVVLDPEPDATTALASFDNAETAAVTRLNDAIRRSQAHELKDAAFADLVEREVLPPYRQMHAQLKTHGDAAPERLRPLFGVLGDYTAARLAAWEALVVVAREPDLEKQQPLIATHKAREAEVTALRTTYEAEIARLQQ
jgi:rhomboid protease GluP